MSEMLSHSDVAQLMNDRSPASRIVTAQKLGAQYAESTFSEAEQNIADDIIRLLARDTELKVRKTLAEVIKRSDRLPHDVARTLAADVDPVATPILEFCPVLTDDDLLEVISAASETKQIAISKRAMVSQNVSDALIETAREAVVQSLLENQGADIADDGLVAILERHGQSDIVRQALVHRRRLPVQVTERLITMVSDRLQTYLMTHHELPEELASDLISETRQSATADVLVEPMSETEIDPLVAHLDNNGRLTPSLVVRSLCLGNMTFFSSALARRADIPPCSARRLLQDGGLEAISSLLHQADIPPAMRGVVNIAMTEAREMAFDGDTKLRDAFFRRVLEKILQSDEYIEPEDLVYLQSHMAQLTLSSH